jgi:starch synthase (maltosyl-transferring)
MEIEGKKRVIIENVQPEIEGGNYPIKRVIGEEVVVEADIFSDGHDSISANLIYRPHNNNSWREVPMKYMANDRWKGTFTVEKLGNYYYSLKGWINHFETWQESLKKKYEAGQDITIDLNIGVELLKETSQKANPGDQRLLEEYIHAITNADREKAISIVLDRKLCELINDYTNSAFRTKYAKDLVVVVDRKKALFSAWYEHFPRSTFQESVKHGTFMDCEKLLPEIARMGFDVLYFPPIHPIGKTNRKGKNNSLVAKPGDEGSPWAIGSDEGGHKAVHPKLGTIKDFEHLTQKAKEFGIEIAMDLAFQCSPDHPYVKEHPEWFKWRPDGTIQYAENPPKKYEDIVPINFETEQWESLWEELKSVVLFWIAKGVRIFRVDNPHTKPFRFWEWLIRETKKNYPEVIFLSEAFTRPKVMHALGKVGFTQSYTYFTWRNTKREFLDYLTELLSTEVREYFKPNFWTNTPDILPEHIQYGGKPVFIMRLILAATLSSNYGIYGPPFELCVREALPEREEYLNSEKYEVRQWNWDSPGNIKEWIVRINKIRKENPALQTTWNLNFYEVDNNNLLCYGKASQDLTNILLMVVNLDPFHTQSGWVKIPLSKLEIDPKQSYLVHDLLSDDKYIWQGEKNYVEINPQVSPAHIFRVRKRLKRETDFDYFM